MTKKVVISCWFVIIILCWLICVDESYEFGYKRDSNIKPNNVFYVIPMSFDSGIKPIIFNGIKWINMYTMLYLYIFLEIMWIFRWIYLTNFVRKYMKPDTFAPKITNDRRHHLVKQAIKYAHMVEGGFKSWWKLWFDGANISDICIENAKKWLNWAIFVDQNADEHQRQFVNEYTDQLQNVLGYKFKDGYNKDTKHAANTSREIPVFYRPMIIYLCIDIAQNILKYIFVYVYGFQYKIINGLKVWYHLSNNKTNSEPFCMIHGLGIYYGPYMSVIHQLIRKTNNNKYDIIFIEIPWITLSLRHYIPYIFKSYLTMELIPNNIDSFINILQNIENTILKYPRKNKNISSNNSNNKLRYNWTLYGHSYGTFIVSGIYRYLKEYNNTNLPRLILCDPVSLCLSHPVTVSAVCFKRDIITEILKLFVMNDIMISVCLNRYFHWFEYVLYPNELHKLSNNNKHIFVLSDYDTLVPTKLIKNSVNKLKCNPYIDVISFKSHHAVWLSNHKSVNHVIQSILNK